MVNDRLRVLGNGVEPSTGGGGGDVGDGVGGGGWGECSCGGGGGGSVPALDNVRRLTYFFDYKNTF